jgi:hypothetical protein
VSRSLLLVVAVLVVCGLITAGAFWLLDVLLGDMPHPLWGFVGGAAVGVLSYLRTGWSDRRDRRRAG